MTAPPPPRQGVASGPPTTEGPVADAAVLRPPAPDPDADSLTHALSHDLRAPLRAIEGYAQALVEDYGDRLPDQAREFVSRIRQARRTVEDRVDALLRLSRLGHGALHSDPTDLAPVVSRILEDLARTEPGRRVATRVADRIPVLGDPALLGIAIENLLTNAWKFTRRAACPLITVAVTRAGDDVVISVSDNGIGFDMRQAHRLGVPFQRLHAPGAFEGLGIGLASARRIVERHGGRLWAESVPGQGATFHLSLPAAPPD
ncbi:ATP-binding protein [Luteitalea sp. TBR-22]|uniref:sensor histidine kinase n=1 Tax=Luteitalea sp. TBR-22 TaxID=2802971 RepID=UPI001EF739DF|nr:ATP-binding protein [Luteitalea sp. TBR-22]